LFLETKSRVIANIVRINKDAVDRLLFVLIRFAGLDVLIGLFDRQFGEVYHWLENGCANFVGLDRLGNIRATVKTDNDDLAFARALESCIGAESHRVITRDETLDVWELLDDGLRLLEGFCLIPVGTLGRDLFQLGILA